MNIDNIQYKKEEVNEQVTNLRPILDKSVIEEKNQESLQKIKEIIEKYKFD